MTLADEAFQQFEQYEMPALLLAVGSALDEVLTTHRNLVHGTLALRVELDPSVKVAITRQYRAIKTRILDAARTHLAFREREGMGVELELFDSGAMMRAELFSVTASVLPAGKATSAAERTSAEAMSPNAAPLGPTQIQVPKGRTTT